MKNPFHIFRIKREERWLALAAFLLITVLNALCIYKYFDKFTQITNNYHDLFVKNFHISGFDPITYTVVSHWDTGYNIYRHPLLAFFMYVPNQLNQGMMMLTGINLVQFIVAAILIFCSFYAFIFFYRILREIVALQRIDATILTVFFYSFSYILVSSIVPDHFILSMFMLILTLYVAGKKMQRNHPFTKWQTILFFFITAGISLNNGVKVFLANLFVNGKKFWRPANLILAVIIPSALIWVGARMEWNHFEKSKYQHRQEVKAQKDFILRANIYKNYLDTVSATDSAEIAAGFQQLMKKRIHDKYVSDHQKPWNLHTGKPINKTEFGQWTDISTPRWATLVENFFGEPIQLHRDHLLQDTLTKRPVIVEYRWIGSYVVEAIIILMFILGICFARRSRFFWMAFSFFTFDVFIHIILGFGINEVYIMGAHYLFIIPLAIAYLVRRLRKEGIGIARVVLSLIAVYLYIYNITLLTQYILE
jgi:hypothetical protein